MEIKYKGDIKDDVLIEGDVVIFSFSDSKYIPIRCNVEHNHLSCLIENNGMIFRRLEMNKKEKFDFCNYFYGYRPRGGAWPEAKKDDYEALTRLVIGLYNIIEAKEMGIILYK